MKLYNLELPFQTEHQQLVKNMIILDKNLNYILSGKTGMFIDNNRYYGIFVGYVEKDDNVYFFITNINKDIYDVTLNNESKKMTYMILNKLDIL